ncbi:MAG TPA: hypothetical protein ENN67_07870, partial [Firmicutes bacterium]|nr:hypothetical protein [Bacillota bacterium]
MSLSSSIIHPDMVTMTDTIYALATAVPSREGSGIAIIRVNGPDSFELVSKLTEPFIDVRSLTDRCFKLAWLVHDGMKIDHAGLLPFRNPHSYTGEDVVEIHCHGGLAVIRSIERAL